jgi:hypothetical protein
MYALQIFLYCTCAIASGVMFLAWRRLRSEQKKKVWRFYGWYAALACIGSVFGIAAECLGIKYERSIALSSAAQNVSERFASEAEVSVWSSVVIVPDAFQICFVNVALLIVLDRLVNVAFSTSTGLNARLVLAERVVMGIVICLSVLSICFSAASAYYFRQCISPLNNAAAAILANDFKSSAEYNDTFRMWKLLANKTHSAQLISTTAAILFVLVTFVAVVLVCSRRIREINKREIVGSSARQKAMFASVTVLDLPADSADLSDSNSSDLSPTLEPPRISERTAQLVENLKSVHRQILATVAVVFVALLCMAIFQTFYASATFNDIRFTSDTVSFCDPKATTNSLFGNWMLLNPEFFILGVYMPPPFAMLVALWGMTSKLMLKMIKSHRDGDTR